VVDTFSELEQQAKEFKEDTGLLAPFKDAPAAVGNDPHYSQNYREESYRIWIRARKRVARDLGETLCCLAGNLMLEDRPAGTLLAQQLQPVVDYIKTRYLPELPRKEDCQNDGRGCNWCSDKELYTGQTLEQALQASKEKTE
jgi:hypothetical protein